MDSTRQAGSNVGESHNQLLASQSQFALQVAATALVASYSV